MSPAYTLVIQADTLDPHHLHELAHLAEATHMDHPVPASRACGAAPAQRAATLALCEQWGYDGAYVEAGRSFADFGLLVSDMDSTLITIECIDEIADLNGLSLAGAHHRTLDARRAGLLLLAGEAGALLRGRRKARWNRSIVKESG